MINIKTASGIRPVLVDLGALVWYQLHWCSPFASLNKQKAGRRLLLVFFKATLNISIMLCHVGCREQTKISPVVKVGHLFTSCVTVERSCMRVCVYVSRGVVFGAVHACIMVWFDISV